MKTGKRRVQRSFNKSNISIVHQNSSLTSPNRRAQHYSLFLDENCALSPLNNNNRVLTSQMKKLKNFLSPKLY